MSVAKTLRAERARIVTEARTLIEKADGTAEDMAKFDAMMEQADALQARIDRTEKAAALEADLAVSREVQAAGRGVSAAQVEDEAARDKRLLRAYLSGNVQALGDDDRRIVASRIQAAAGTSTTGGGGFTIA